MTRQRRSLASPSRVATLALAAAAAVALLVPAPAGATSEEALATAKSATAALAKHGFEVQATLWAGTLPPGGKTSVELTLYQGNEYLLVVGGCSDCQDMNVAVYDENWKLVTHDENATSSAGVIVRPQWTGTYHAVIEMARASAEGAHWTLVTGFR